MGTTADKLTYLVETKDLIKQAIISKGIDVSDKLTFREYSDLIKQIENGPNDAQNNFKPMIKVSAKAYYLIIKRAQAYNILTVPIVTSATGGIKE